MACLEDKMFLSNGGLRQLDDFQKEISLPNRYETYD